MILEAVICQVDPGISRENRPNNQYITPYHFRQKTDGGVTYITNNINRLRFSTVILGELLPDDEPPVRGL